MGVFYDDIPDYLIEWIRKQQMFWIATAPLTPMGHVNVSPKGMAGTFKVIDNNNFMYQDLSGSGAETIAHLRENGRITVMFQEFEGAPRICRLFGTGLWHEFGSPEYERLVPRAERLPGSRSVIVVRIHKVGTSCGYAVPCYNFTSHRTKLLDFFSNLEEKDSEILGPSTCIFSQSPSARATASLSSHLDCSNPGNASTPNDSGLFHYWGLKNSASVDGLPALYIGEKYAKYFSLDPCALKPFVPKKIKGGRALWDFDIGKVKVAAALKTVVDTIADSRFSLGVLLGMGIMFVTQQIG